MVSKMLAQTLCCVLCVLTAHTIQAYDRTFKHRMLDDAVRMFRGYKDLPPELADLETDTTVAIPTYMRELYFRYINHDVPTGSSYANTVRSINAEIGLVDSDSMFIFNLSSVESTETFINSNIHVFKKKKRVGVDIKVTLYELAPYYVTELASHDITNSDVGWYTFSVSNAVKSCLSVRRHLPHILALSFMKTNSRGKPRPLHLKAFIRHMSRPFLVVYTNSSLNLTSDQVTARIPPKEDLPNTFINPENGQRETFDNLRRKSKVGRKPSTASNDQSRDAISPPNQNVLNSKGALFNHPMDIFDPYDGDFNIGSKQELQVDTHSQSTTQRSQDLIPIDPTHDGKENDLNIKFEDDDTLSKQELLQKKRLYDKKQNSIRERFIRSVEDNRLPEDSVKVLSKDLQNEGAQGAQTEYLEPAPTEFIDIFSDEYLQSQYLPNQQTNSKKNSQKQRRRKEPNNNENSRTSKLRDPNEITFPDEWDFEFDTHSDNFNNQNFNQMVNPVYSNRKCGVKKMILDFADVGWSDWIIEPKSFVSNFCAGTCSFPQPLAKGLSNHASLKSLVHTVGIHSDIPPPCCIPEHMQSQSVLYIDQNKNVVLKNYRNMAVSSCKCV